MEISRHMGRAADVCNTNRFLGLLGGAPVPGLTKSLRHCGGAPHLTSKLLGEGG